MDWTDHVWAEIYIPSLGRWCHADPCEASWCSPPLNHNNSTVGLHPPAPSLPSSPVPACVWFEFCRGMPVACIYLRVTRCCCRDSAMLYEGGWGKKLTYIISCSSFETVDVTRRYTAHWHDVLQRRLEVPEDWLKRTLAQLNTQLQFQTMLPDVLHREHEARRAAESLQLQQMHPQATFRTIECLHTVEIDASAGTR
jgi:hypothetical protein